MAAVPVVINVGIWGVVPEEWERVIATSPTDWLTAILAAVDLDMIILPTATVTVMAIICVAEVPLTSGICHTTTWNSRCMAKAALKDRRLPIPTTPPEPRVIFSWTIRRASDRSFV